MNEGADWLPLLWLLLPVAALSGWVAARSGRGGARRPAPPVPPGYFRGLNYLLNEQPDKAIEEFMRMVEVDQDTVETHLALGSLFRRRGEVDRAIRIHQNLIARTSLTREQRLLSTLELALDYMRSGLLDRAEGLFRELVDAGAHERRSLEQLLDIYQQERDWPNAIATAVRLQGTGAPGLDPVIAHFHCEMAEAALRAGDAEAARAHLRDASERDGRCVRASILEAGIEERSGNPRGAIAAYARIGSQDAEYLPEVIVPLKRCHDELGEPREFEGMLNEMVARRRGVRAQLLHTELLAERKGTSAAVDFLSMELRSSPSVAGVNRLLELSGGDGSASPTLAAARAALAILELQQPVYRCANCGFGARLLHWQCPSCKQWNTVKPVHGARA